MGYGIEKRAVWWELWTVRRELWMVVVRMQMEDLKNSSLNSLVFLSCVAAFKGGVEDGGWCVVRSGTIICWL